MTIASEAWAVIGVVVSAVLVYLGVLRTNRSKDIETAAGLLAEWKALLEAAKNEFREDIERERQARMELERKMTGQVDEVIDAFATYYEWARAGAHPPPPYIADWIWARIKDRPDRP